MVNVKSLTVKLLSIASAVFILWGVLFTFLLTRSRDAFIESAEQMIKDSEKTILDIVSRDIGTRKELFARSASHVAEAHESDLADISFELYHGDEAMIKKAISKKNMAVKERSIKTFEIVSKVMLERSRKSVQGEIQQLGDYQIEKSQKLAKKMQIELAAVILIGIATLVMVEGFWIYRVVILPIQKLAEGAARIAKGDMTYRVKIKPRDEIGKLADSFNRMVEDLQTYRDELVHTEKLAVVGELAGGVSHELRNPLGVIANSVYFLSTKLKDVDGTVRKHLRILQKEVKRSDYIISELLNFATARPPSFNETDINSAVKDALASIKVSEKIAVNTRLNESLPAIQCDPDQIRQVFQSIISNAVQAIPEGGELEIKTGVKEGFVEIAFRDTGMGIPEENTKKIFEPLFGTRAKGIGLGLAIAKNIVDGHKGGIEVESEVGRGTTFLVKLPIKKILAELQRVPGKA